MADTIQEYLIGLGYKIDEPGLAKFNLFIGTTAKSFAALSATVATTTMQVVESVTRIAKQFESLYYASQRTGETVAGLQAVGFAAQQIGVSSQAAQGAIESFARAIRTNPGIEGLLKQLGVGPGSPMERLKQFIQNTQAMPYYIRAQYAGMLGMDEQTFRMMTLEGGFERFAREQEDFIRRQREAGIDAKALSEHSVEFSRSWNRLSSDASIFGEVLSKNVLPILQKLVDFLDRVVQKVNSVFGDKAKSAASANKLSYYIEASNASFLHGLGLMSDDEYQKEIREIWGRQNAGGGPAGSVAAPPPAAGPAGGGAAAGRTNSAAVMRYFEGKGYSHAAAAAIAANVQGESGYNPESFNGAGGGQGAYGLFQWRGPRLAELRARYGMHPTAEQQLDFAAWELQNSESATGRLMRGPIGDAATLGTWFSHNFERHGDAAEDARRGQLAARLNIAPVTNITISGVSDPRRAAELTDQQLINRNGDLIRNLQGAVR